MILYVANRGEIARRVLSTASRLGIRTIVGYADQDKNLPFVNEADEAVCLEGTEPEETYLHIEKVISAAKAAGATHIHPGYGFLSENPKFVKAVLQAGLDFVGPTAENMELLGDKIGSRRFLKKHQIPLLPSYEGDDQSDSCLTREAAVIGFPLLIKPSAGGGGKGMIKVESSDKFLESLHSSKRIAKSSFGDDRVFLEKYVHPARHIEVQILADREGNVLTLGERECSLQRNHQKVIEETPCDFLRKKVRDKLMAASKKLAEKVHYVSAGTIEWIWDGQEGIYFLEVNTRLQVEHTVTELVWGIDLVEWQLKLASGENLKPLMEEKKEPKGHAIEARLCAEDPQNDYMPSSGKIHRLKLPRDLRIDFGYEEKNHIPAQFDSLLGKIISYGENRIQATQKLIEALEKIVLFGPITNRSYLIQILGSDEFEKGLLSTSLLADMPFECEIETEKEVARKLSSEARVSNDEDDLDLYSPWGPLFGELEATSDEGVVVEDFGEKRYFHTPRLDWTEDRPGIRKRSSDSSVHGVDSSELKSPMPSKISKILVKESDKVAKGDLVVVIEAMKMEHKIKASRDAVVGEILVKEGERVQMDATLIRWE